MTIIVIMSINLLLVGVWELHRVSIFLSESLASQPSHQDHRADLINYNKNTWVHQFYKEFKESNTMLYRPYIGWKRGQFMGETINIDKEGNRKTIQHPNLNSNSNDIIFLGGSTMWGTGSDDANTIPSLFAKQSKGFFKCYNFGETAYRAFQSYIYLLQKYNSGLQPKWVVTYDGVNEAMGFLTDIAPNSTYIHKKIGTNMHNKKTSSFVSELTYRHLLLSPIENTIARVKAKLKKGIKHNIDISDERVSLVARSLLDSWVSIHDLTEKNNTNLLVILQPNAAIGHPNISHLSFSDHEELLMKTYNILYDKVRELISTDPKYKILQDNFLDLSNSFDGGELIYIDWCHVSPNGNQIISKQIFNYIFRN